jgi:6-pyruvoyl-tetrahydropterin synthase
MARLILNRRYLFQAVHSLKHHLERRHGHHYALEVSFHAAAGWKVADQSVQQAVLARLHAREIDVVDAATGENIVNWIHRQLASTPLGPHLVAVALQETRKNRFISGDSDPDYV